MSTSAKTLKYESEVDAICASGTACPPDFAVEKTTPAYRWCGNQITANCFNPQAVRNPPRLHKAKDLEERCSCWALSMHADLEASLAAFKNLEKSFTGIRKIFGGAVAFGVVLPQHGRCTPPDGYSHFDLHEYKMGSVAAAFTVHSVVPTNP